MFVQTTIRLANLGSGESKKERKKSSFVFIQWTLFRSCNCSWARKPGMNSFNAMAREANVIQEFRETFMTQHDISLRLSPRRVYWIKFNQNRFTINQKNVFFTTQKLISSSKTIATRIIREWKKRININIFVNYELPNLIWWTRRNQKKDLSINYSNEEAWVIDMDPLVRRFIERN